MNENDWQWHYVKQNEASRYPRRIVCLDTESQRSVMSDTETHSFRLGVASFDAIDPRTRAPARTEWLESDDTATLWEWITGRCKSRERLVCFAHNLGYDLRISQAFTLLPSLGFRLRFVSLDSRRCYARFSRGDATLVLSDSSSYFPTSLDTIASEIGMAKLPLPDDGDDPDKWFARCRRDTEILRAAMLELLGHLERTDSGNFKPTGPSQAWATYRHRFLRPRTLLVHREAEVLEAERRAAWTGRTEAWRHGEYYYPLVEMDYRLAYATIATQEFVPCRYLGSITGGTLGSETSGFSGEANLCLCRVTTKAPIVPCSLGGRIAWPVGSFQTCLWDREARIAIAAGATVEVERTYRYRTAPILKEWGEWIIRQLTDETENVSPLIRIMLKHWARCLIGRFGMRYPDWRPIGRSETSDLTHFECFDLDSDARSEYLQLANEWYSCEQRKDGHDTAPAVMSYVMSIQRIKLWDAIQAAGESEVFYCDTDSLLVTPTGAMRLQELRKRYGHDNLIRKAEYSHAEIHAPRCLILDGQPRIAGLSRRAVSASRQTFKTQVWQSLGDSLRNGTPSEVRVTPRSFRIPTEDFRRRHLAYGLTEPYRTELPA